MLNQYSRTSQTGPCSQPHVELHSSCAWQGWWQPITSQPSRDTPVHLERWGGRKRNRWFLLSSALSSPYSGVSPAWSIWQSCSPTDSGGCSSAQAFREGFESFTGREGESSCPFLAGKNLQPPTLTVFCSGIRWNKLHLHSTAWPCHQRDNVLSCPHPRLKQPRRDLLTLKDSSQTWPVISWVTAEQIPGLALIGWMQTHDQLCWHLVFGIWKELFPYCFFCTTPCELHLKQNPVWGEF